MRRDPDYTTRCRVRELLIEEIVSTRARIEGDGPPLTDDERDAAVAWERALLAEAEWLRLRDRRWVRGQRAPVLVPTVDALGRRWRSRAVRPRRGTPAGA